MCENCMHTHIHAHTHNMLLAFTKWNYKQYDICNDKNLQCVKINLKNFVGKEKIKEKPTIKKNKEINIDWLVLYTQ
jgi:hypothetical protein